MEPLSGITFTEDVYLLNVNGDPDVSTKTSIFSKHLSVVYAFNRLFKFSMVRFLPRSLYGFYDDYLDAG